MRRPNIVQMALGAGAIVLLGASALGYADRGDTGSEAGPDAVLIDDFAYGPDVIEASVGATVTWTNDDDFAHTITSKSEGPLDSGNVAAGGTYRAAFDTPGSFEYVCTIHPSMKGIVEVTGT